MIQSTEQLKELARADNTGLRRRLISGISSQFFNTLLVVSSRFLLIPLYLHAWGVDGFADWLVLVAASLMATFFSLGQQTRYGNLVREAWAYRNIETLEDVYASAQGFFLVLFLVLITSLGLLVTALDVPSILNLRTLDHAEASLALIALCLAGGGVPYKEFLRALPIARQDFTRTELVVSLSVLLSIGGTAIALVLFKAPIVVVAFIQLFTEFLLVAVFFLVGSIRRYADLKLRLQFTRRHLPKLADLYVYGVPNGANWLTGSAPIFILSLVDVPGVQIAQFGVARTVGVGLRLGLRQISVLFAFEINRQNIQHDRRGMRRLHRIGSALLGVTAGGAIGSLMASWDLIVGTWTGGEIPVDLLLLALIMAQFGAAGLGEVLAGLLRYSRYTRDLAFATTACAIGYLLLPYTLATMYGVYGVAASVSALDILFFYLVPAFMVQRRFGLPALGSLGIPAVSGIVVGTASFLAVDLCRGFFGL